MDQSLFPAPHGLSQGITSFIASCCQGIHQTPFSRLIRSRESRAFPDQKRTLVRSWFSPDAVSVLDLDNVAGRDDPRKTPHAGPATLMFLMSLHDVSLNRPAALRPLEDGFVRLDGQAADRCLAVKSPEHGNGGACRDRTDDPLLAKQVLSQLS